MTEQDTTDVEQHSCDFPSNEIEASFGPMSVYVSGNSKDGVRETFDEVWETMIDTSETMREMKQDAQDNSGHGSGPSFGD